MKAEDLNFSPGTIVKNQGMTIRRSYLLLALALVTSGAIIFILIGGMPFGLLVPRNSHPVIHSDRPLSLAEVKGIKFPFPATATNIQFAEYREFIAYQYVVRFEAPKEDCLATVAKVVQAFRHSGTTPDAVAELSQIRPIAAERDHVKEVGDFSVPWFDPENIKNGVEAGKRSSHTPKIWIDTDRGAFYFQYTD